MSSTDIAIRDANLADIPSITRIYAYAVMNTVATLDTDEPTVATQTEWFRQHDEQHPVLVAESDGTVVGWASLSGWSAKAGYRLTAEASVYVSPECHRQGIGTRLLQELAARARDVGLHVVVARISSTNATSLRLARRCGFSHVGTMNESGFKFGGYVDVEVLQLILDAPHA